MLSYLTQCAKLLWSRLTSAANQWFRRSTQPASPNVLTGTLADLPQGDRTCREGFRPFWRFKSRVQTPSNRLATESIALIQRMARENPLWGAERIRSELLKLEIRVAKRTIQ